MPIKESINFRKLKIVTRLTTPHSNFQYFDAVSLLHFRKVGLHLLQPLESLSFEFFELLRKSFSCICHEIGKPPERRKINKKHNKYEDMQLHDMYSRARVNVADDAMVM